MAEEAHNQQKAPKIFGRQIYPATLIGNSKKKGSDKQINFAIGRGEIEVYSIDWKTCLYNTQIEKVKYEVQDNNLITFTYYNNPEQTQKVSFTVHFDRTDVITSVLTTPTPDKQKEGNSMTILELPAVLSFGCSLKEAADQALFKQFLESQARKRVLFLTSSTKISDSLLMAISCEFRMRFPRIDKENWAEAFDVLWYEFVAFCVSLWTQCLKTVVEPHTGPNSFEYFRRMAASVIGLIARGADAFGVDRAALLEAGRRFIDLGDPSGISESSRMVVSNVELALGNYRKRWLLQVSDLFEFTQVYSAGVVLAESLIEECKESKNLAQVIAAWAVSLSNNTVRPPRMVDFRNSLEKLAVSVLKASDSNRYGPDFHVSLALWKLAELVKITE